MHQIRFYVKFIFWQINYTQKSRGLEGVFIAKSAQKYTKSTIILITLLCLRHDKLI